MASLTASQTAILRTWLARCIGRLESMPPTPERNVALAILNTELERYETNVVPFRGRAA